MAEELHFRKAADRLFISQPGLSRQIKQMETELGFALFERTNKKVILTKAGKYLKEEVTMLLKNLNDSFDHAQLIQIIGAPWQQLRFSRAGSWHQQDIAFQIL